MNDGQNEMTAEQETLKAGWDRLVEELKKDPVSIKTEFRSEIIQRNRIVGVEDMFSKVENIEENIKIQINIQKKIEYKLNKILEDKFGQLEKKIQYVPCID